MADLFEAGLCFVPVVGPLASACLGLFTNIINNHEAFKEANPFEMSGDLLGGAAFVEAAIIGGHLHPSRDGGDCPGSRSETRINSSTFRSNTLDPVFHYPTHDHSQIVIIFINPTIANRNISRINNRRRRDREALHIDIRRSSAPPACKTSNTVLADFELPIHEREGAMARAWKTRILVRVHEVQDAKDQFGW